MIKERCNTSESGIGTTTAAGTYASGVSVYGAYDMAGNVWEWNANEWSKGSGTRVLRGGSWGSALDFAACAVRYGNYPDYRHFDIGFRCARASP